MVHGAYSCRIRYFQNREREIRVSRPVSNTGLHTKDKTLKKTKTLKVCQFQEKCIP